MQRRPIVLSAAAAVLAAGVLATAACGGDDSSASPTTTPATTAAAATAPATTAPTATATAVAVALGTPKEFSLVPSVASVPSGKVTFTVNNSGKVLHEMVVVPSPGGAASLKQPDGSASEANSPGEAPDVEPGQTKTLTITLKPGKYTLLCNLPGHFAGGMYASFTVK
ncbi:MAG: cupredoxin domain-containing protein [Thermoleophilia bacterium]